MKNPIQLIGNNLLALIMEEEEKKPTIIILDKPMKIHVTCEVIGLGTDAVTPLNVGDRFLVNRRDTRTIVLEDKEFLVVPCEDIIGILENIYAVDEV